MLRYLVVAVFLVCVATKTIPSLKEGSRPTPPKHCDQDAVKRLSEDNDERAFLEWTADSKRKIWEFSGLYERDIMINSVGYNALQGKDKMWPNGVVPYFFEKDHFDKKEKEIITGALKEIEEKTCVSFREREEDDTDFVAVTSDYCGCYSFLGRNGGRQVLNLGKGGCVSHGVVLHEFLHALGFYHQHNAPNRDDYVTVRWENIEPDYISSFHKNNATTDFGVGYDYDSIMHYGSHDLTKNGEPTLVPKKEGVEIGQGKHLSEKDVEKIRRMYKCANKPDPEESNDLWFWFLKLLNYLLDKIDNLIKNY